jgi:hypothetical protein
MVRRLFATTLLCVACYDPNIPSGGFSCGATNNFLCPEGFTCSGGVCIKGAATDAGTPPETAGCSDGTREGLTSLNLYPDIAACDGAWDQKGIVDVAQMPHCSRQAGNSGVQSDGHGCAAADLCASGWHVCNDQHDVANHHGVEACGELGSSGHGFYASRQRGQAVTGICAGVGTADSNNVNGCGAGIGVGYMVDVDMCTPLNRRLEAIPNGCGLPWDCGTDDQVEGDNVTKSGSSLGGVLCCHD